MRTHSSQRGVTLVELMVVVAVTLVVISGVTVTMSAQQKAYLNGQRLRAAQGSARRALLALERTIPSAGFGLDAPLAFDAGWYGGPCPATFGTCARDSVSTSDELVFHARDQRYYVAQNPADDPVGNAWRITGVTSSAVTVLARAGDVFRAGQIFLAVCTGSTAYAYFTSSQTVTASSAGSLSISLQSVVASNPFRRQDVAAALPCFNPPALPSPPPTPARLFLVNRYRFHVRPVQVGTLGSTAVYDPLLVLDRGIDVNGDGNVNDLDEEIVAEGIESIQVAYGFNAVSGLGLTGTTPGIGLATASGTPAAAGTAADTVTTTSFPGGTPLAGQTDYSPSSFYGFTFGPPPAPERLTNHQGNIQLVRVAVLARSLEPDLQGAMTADRMLPVLNQNALPTWVTAYANALGGHDGYQRVVLETTVGLPNMSSRAMTYF